VPLFPDCDAKVETFSETTKSFRVFFPIFLDFSTFSLIFYQKQPFFCCFFVQLNFSM